MNKKKIKILALTFSVLLSAGFYVSQNDEFFEISQGIDLFTKIYKEIALNYVDSINPQEFMLAGIKGMLNTVDPYTVFMDEKKQSDLDVLTNGRYGGIGVSIGLRDNKITILEILDGYSAQKQGLLIGDVVIKVDSLIVNEDNFDEVSLHVKGDPGTFVKLDILREGITDTLHFELHRDEIKLKSVSFAGFVGPDSSIAYIKLTQFARTSSDDVRGSLMELMKQKEIKGVIFDIRNNPGGLLETAVDISNKFLNKDQLIVSTLGRDSSSLKRYYAAQQPLIRNIPLIVLINEGSASASEIFAGAIQDHDRGVILGAKSFGKGLVQTIIPLTTHTSLKITTAKYFTPSGRCIQKIDYSKGNRVFASASHLQANKFLTDNKRIVFSSGGIYPDTIVADENTPLVIRDMLARGMFFKFANYLYGREHEKNFVNLKDQFLLNEFQSFLKTQSYSYQSEIEKKLAELSAIVKNDKQFVKLSSGIAQLQTEAKNTSSFDVEEYRQELLEEIRIELRARYDGAEGRIRESLLFDNQFQSALSVIKNLKQYNSILTGK